MERLTWFGERADFSPDNAGVAFMAKSFGDAMAIDLATRRIRCLTCAIPAAAFLRVMHFSSGDYLLIGPEQVRDIRSSRHQDNELWHMGREPGARPVRLGQKMSEGAAVSKKSLKIAFSETGAQNPELKGGASRITVADLDLSGGAPRLGNRKVVYSRPDNSCTLEAQDFCDNDARLTLSCYEPKGMASVWSLDLRSGQVNLLRKPGAYNEVEGIFLDNLIAQGKAKPMIMVSPLGYGAPEMMAGLATGRGGGPEFMEKNIEFFAKALMQEVMPLVEKNYRVSRKREE